MENIQHQKPKYIIQLAYCNIILNAQQALKRLNVVDDGFKMICSIATIAFGLSSKEISRQGSIWSRHWVLHAKTTDSCIYIYWLCVCYSCYLFSECVFSLMVSLWLIVAFVYVEETSRLYHYNDNILYRARPTLLTPEYWRFGWKKICFVCFVCNTDSSLSMP